MRIPAITYALMCGVLIAGDGAIAQPAPPAKTICELPEYKGTPAYERYCSSGVGGAPSRQDPRLHGGYGPNMSGGVADQNLFGLPFYLMGKMLSPSSPPHSPRDKRAYDLNAQGIAAHHSGNLTQAAYDFQQALALNPNDSAIRRNLANVYNGMGFQAFKAGDGATALRWLGQTQQMFPGDAYATLVISKIRANALADRGNAAWRAGDLDTAMADYRQAYALDHFQGFLDQIDALQAQGQARADAVRRTGLVTADIRTAAASYGEPQSALTGAGANGLGFSDFVQDAPGPANARAQAQEPGVTSGALGGKVVHPDDSTLRSAKAGAGAANAADQASSAAHADAEAGAKTAPGLETSKRVAGCAFDTFACRDHEALGAERVKAMGQTPGAAELVAHIGKTGMADTGIQQSVAYYQKIDGLKTDAQQRLAALAPRLASNDPQALNEKAALDRSISGYSADQAKVQTQIQTQMASKHIAWDEAPTPPAPQAPIRTADATQAPSK